jgi:Lantibiotic dehydratase, N terminus
MKGAFHDWFLWRITGFPCESLEAFALPNLSEDITKLLSKYNLNLTHWDRLRNNLLSNSEIQALEQIFRLKLKVLRINLAKLVCSDLFQSAVSSSSPSAALRLLASKHKNMDIRRSKDKRLELLGMRYLQRFVTKCETSAFFGPVATGYFGIENFYIDFKHSMSNYDGKTFLGDNLLSQLIKYFRNLPNVLTTEHIKRRSGVCLKGKDTLIHPTIGKLKVNELSIKILSSASSDILVGKMIKLLPYKKKEILATIRALLEIGMLNDELEITWHKQNPISYLKRIVSRSGSLTTETKELFKVLNKGLKQWQRDSAYSRYKMLDKVRQIIYRKGILLEKKSGFYSDHLPFVEDGYCDGSYLCIDKNWASDFFNDLEIAIQERLSIDYLRRKWLWDKICNIPSLKNRSTISLSNFIEELVTNSVLENYDSGINFGISTSDLKGHAIVSPDIMIAGSDLDSIRRGDFKWVLSECHSSIGHSGFFTRVISDQESWLKDISIFLTNTLNNMKLINITNKIFNKTFHEGYLPSIDYLEVGLRAHPAANSINIDDIIVKLDKEPKLMLRNTKERIIILPFSFNTAPPLFFFRSPRYTPFSEKPNGERKVLGSIVVKRKSWELNKKNIPNEHSDSWESFIWCQLLRQIKEMPRWIFIRATNDKKPECIDFCNPFLCEELLRILRKEKCILATEMYPSPEHAWVKNSEGKFLCELRMLYASK